MAKPVVIDLEAEAAPKRSAKAKAKPKAAARPKVSAPLPSPADAPPVEDLQHPTGQAVHFIAERVSKGLSPAARIFWAAFMLLFTGFLGAWGWDYVLTTLAAPSPFRLAVLVLLGVMLACLVALATREAVGFARLSRIDDLRARANALGDHPSLDAAKAYGAKLMRFYRGRSDLDWARQSFVEQSNDILDGPALRDVTERVWLAPLDKEAERALETAARQVATGTALVPLAFADVIIALTANLRMIRRIAEIYGGRTGRFGTWRLLRTVAVHLVATGAVAIGDDMLGSLAGGSLLGKLSRRFGEGVVNGALTARVGIAAMDVCRPMPFQALEKPSVSGAVGRALKGFVGKS